MQTPTLPLLTSLLLLATGSLGLAAPLTVTSDADGGAGSLRDAVDLANADPSIRSIIISRNLGPIEVSTPVEYTGGQDLSIDGRGATVIAADTFSGDGIFVSSGSANLVLTRLIFDGDFELGESPANGIFVPVDALATGEISVTLNQVTLVNHALFGLHVADQLEDSDASISLTVRNCTITNSGIGELDFDGIRVDEGGNGDIIARIVDTSVEANGGDGLELDERGSGSVDLQVVNSHFDDNGFFNEEDLDDGLDVDEAGEGSVVARIVACTFSGNFDQGLDLDEEDAGGIDLEVTNSVANGNLGEGMKASEEDDGGLVAVLRNVETSESAEDDGIQLEEEDAGDFSARISNLISLANGKDGLKLDQETVGSDSGVLRLNRAVIQFNGDDDLDLDGVDQQ